MPVCGHDCVTDLWAQKVKGGKDFFLKELIVGGDSQQTVTVTDTTIRVQRIVLPPYWDCQKRLLFMINRPGLQSTCQKKNWRITATQCDVPIWMLLSTQDPCLIFWEREAIRSYIYEAGTRKRWVCSFNTPVTWQPTGTRQTGLHSCDFHPHTEKGTILEHEMLHGCKSSHDWGFNNYLTLSSGTVFGMLCCGTILNEEQNMNPWPHTHTAPNVTKPWHYLRDYGGMTISADTKGTRTSLRPALQQGHTCGERIHSNISTSQIDSCLSAFPELRLYSSITASKPSWFTTGAGHKREKLRACSGLLTLSVCWWMEPEWWRSLTEGRAGPAGSLCWYRGCSSVSGNAGAGLGLPGRAVRCSTGRKANRVRKLLGVQASSKQVKFTAWLRQLPLFGLGLHSPRLNG